MRLKRAEAVVVVFLGFFYASRRADAGQTYVHLKRAEAVVVVGCAVFYFYASRRADAGQTVCT